MFNFVDIATLLWQLDALHPLFKCILILTSLTHLTLIIFLLQLTKLTLTLLTAIILVISAVYIKEISVPFAFIIHFIDI